MNGTLRSLYISASGMLTQERVMNVITNNIANLNTIGFKSDILSTESFREVLLGRINDPQYNSSGIGMLDYGIHPSQVYTSFEQGPMQETGFPTDMALGGDGFFVVETPQGLRFTRSGNFQVDANGYLTTPEGYFVRSTTGRIKVDNQNFSVDTSGNLTTSAGAKFKLAVVQFANNNVLKKVGDNLYAGPATAKAAACSVQQGFLEGSNVDLGTQMANMINVERNYESNQRMISMLNDTLDKTVNEVGRL